MTEDFISLAKIAAAAVIALPFAINRERHTAIMGLRTFPLVALGTCAFVLVAEGFIPEGSGDASARIVQGILSGIGFVGGGAILKNGDYVKGTECAAAIWVTGAIGVAVAYDRWIIAIGLSVITFLALQFLTSAKQNPDEERA